MSKWYRKVTGSVAEVPNFLTFFENELEDAKKQLSMSGVSLERHAAMMPGITEHRFSQLQEIEAVLEFLNIEMKRIRGRRFKHYFQGYDKALTSRDAEKYVDGDDEVIDQALLINEVALLRNKYLAIHKGLEAKHWQINNVVRLRCAGLEDATVG